MSSFETIFRTASDRAKYIEALRFRLRTLMLQRAELGPEMSTAGKQEIDKLEAEIDRYDAKYDDDGNPRSAGPAGETGVRPSRSGPAPQFEPAPQPPAPPSQVPQPQPQPQQPQQPQQQPQQQLSNEGIDAIRRMFEQQMAELREEVRRSLAGNASGRGPALPSGPSEPSQPPPRPEPAPQTQLRPQPQPQQPHLQPQQPQPVIAAPVAAAGSSRFTGPRMYAYVVLDGGGVKGAALVGALQAAADAGIEWLGNGGTSAGSLVAVLGAVGYRPEEIKHIVTKELSFVELLDDGTGEELKKLESLIADAKDLAAHDGWLPPVAKARELVRRFKEVYGNLDETLGVYSGDRVRKFLYDKIVQKIPALAGQADISFADLAKHGCKPLKVVASDLTSGLAIVFPDESGMTYSVLDAARASMSYPIVFRPVQYGSRRLVDGGLSANLPVFLFEKERRANRAAVIAIDLVGNDSGPKPSAGYTLVRLVQDMLSTAIEASDALMRNQIQGLDRVQVPLNPPVGTLDFSVSPERREMMFQNGYVAFTQYASKSLVNALTAESFVEQLQARFRLSARTIRPVLKSLALAAEQLSTAKNVRVNIMLPTMRGTRIVVYQHGMDVDLDKDLELATGSGFSGIAYTSASPVVGDLVVAGKDPKVLGLTPEQQARIPKDRTAMLCVPIFAPDETPQTSELPQVIGTLSIDTNTPFWDTFWAEQLPDGKTVINPTMLGLLGDWADVFGRLLL